MSGGDIKVIFLDMTWFWVDMIGLQTKGKAGM